MKFFLCPMSWEYTPYHSQWSSNFTAIFDGNYKFLPSIDLERFYGQLKKLRWRARNPPKSAPDICHNMNICHDIN